MTFDYWFQNQQLTQEELAERCGVSQPMISQLVRGLRPSFAVAWRLWRFADCPTAEIWGDKFKFEK